MVGDLAHFLSAALKDSIVCILGQNIKSGKK